MRWRRPTVPRGRVASAAAPSAEDDRLSRLRAPSTSYPTHTTNHPSMSTDNVGVRPQDKRQKHSRACEFCRRRKVACDAADSPGNRCSMCVAQGIECQYDPTAKAKRPTTKYVEVLEHRLSKVEALLKKLQSESALDGNDDEYPVDALKTQKRPNISKQPHPTWGTIRHLCPQGFRPSTDSSEEIDPSDNEEGFAVADANNKGYTGYTGKSSNFELVRTVIGLKTRRDESDSMDLNIPFSELAKRFRPDLFQLRSRVSNISPPFKDTEFPPPDLMAELVDLYFVHLNPYLGLLHRPTFERDVQNGLHLHDRGFGTVVLLVCATGSAWAYGSLHAQPRQTPGWQWFDKVSSANFSLIARPRLYDVQACALMAAYLNATNSPQGTLPLLSLGIRMAQDAGAHRKKLYSATPTVEQELWKRAFWALVAMDRLASFGMGRQCTIHDEDFDVDPATECDDEYWTPPDPSKAFQQPPGKPSKVAFCNAFTRLSKIQAFALRTIFTINKSKLIMGYVGPEWKQRIIAEIDSSMNKWLDTIPPHLRWDPNREDVLFLNQSAILYANYYQLQIFVHRLFIPSPRRPLANPNMSLPSMTICVNAARACLRVLDVQHRRAMMGAETCGVTIYALTPLQMPLSTVGMMLLVYLWCGARDTRAALDDVDVCLNILKDLAETGNFAARKLEAFLRTMIPIAQLPPSERSYPTSSSNLAKEGPKTIEELITTTMKHLDVSMFDPGEGFGGSGACDTAARNGSSSLSTTRTPHAPGLPLARGVFEPCTQPEGMSREQAAEHNRAAITVFGGCDLWALQLNTISGGFVPDQSQSQSPSGSTTTPESVQTDTANGVSPGSSLDSVPTPSDLGVAGPSDFDFTLGTALVPEDMDDFFNSLSSVFENVQDLNTPAPTACGAPQPQSTAPLAASADPAQTCTLSQLELPPAAPSLFGVQGETYQDPSLWQWISTPDGELWNQWEAYVQSRDGAANANQPTF